MYYHEIVAMFLDELNGYAVGYGLTEHLNISSYHVVNGQIHWPTCHHDVPSTIEDASEDDLVSSIIGEIMESDDTPELHPWQ